MKKFMVWAFLLCGWLCSGGNVLENADFSKLDAKGVPAGWFVNGKTQVSTGKNSVTLSLPADHGKQTQATLMSFITRYLTDGKSYVLTCRVTAPKKTAAQVYIEGDYFLGETKKGLLTKNFHPFTVDEKGVDFRVELTVPAKMERAYIALRTTDPAIPVTFSDLKLSVVGEDKKSETVSTVNLLKNVDFKTLDAKGKPESWMLVGKTEFTAIDGGVRLSLPAGSQQAQATAMQHIHNVLEDGKNYVLTCRVKAAAKTAAQVYVEGFCLVDGKRKGLLTDFRPFTVDAGGCTREVAFSIPAKMTRVYLSIRTTNPAVPVEFTDMKIVEVIPAKAASSAPDAVGGNLLRNADFKKILANGTAADWNYIGKTIVTPVDNGVTLSLAPEHAGQVKATVMQHLPDRVEPGKNYVFTCDVKAAKSTRFQLYFEGSYTVDGKHKGFGTRFSEYPVDGNGVKHKIMFTVPAKMDRFYISVRTTNPAIPVTFSNMNLQEVQIKERVIGGFWDAETYPETPAGGVILKGGRTAVLRAVPVKPGKTYKLTYRVEGNGDTGRKNFNFHQYKISSRPIVAGGIAHADVFNKAAVPKVQVITVPETASFSVIDLTFASETAGELKFSDFAMTEYVRDPKENWQFFFTSPCYRNTIYPRTDNGRISGKILAGESAVKAKLSIGGIAELDIPLTDGQGSFDIPAAGVKNGKYPVVCSVLDAQGNILKKFESDLRKVPSAQHEVIFDHRNNLLVDGKPFFSISEYRSKMLWVKGGLYHMARNGVNTFFVCNFPKDPKKLLALLDQLHAFGIKAVLEVWSASSVSPEGKERYIKNFNTVITPEVRQHPALLAYFTNDEPFICGRNPEPIVWTYNFIKDADPYHPVWVNQSPSNAEVVNFKPFVPGSDITGIDIYPVPVPHPHCDLPDKSLNCVGAYTRRMVETVNNRQAIWMILQAFIWHDHNNMKSTARSVYPTMDEMRFMYFDAIFNGSRGVSFYGTTTIKSIPYRELVYSLMREIRDLSGLLTSFDEMPDLPQDNEKVRIARVKSADNVYYAIFNQEPKAKKISFRMDDELVVYREGFKLVPKAGQITLQLRPYEVIICGKSPLPAPANKTIPCNPELEDLRDPVYDHIRSHSGIVEDLFAANYYRGKANWIWNKEQLSQAGSSCVLVKRFTLDTIPAGAELLFCADDEADAYLNGKFVGKGDEHGRLWRYDVRNMLKTGENILVINARDGGGLPCAMLAEFRADGKVLFVSDEKWEAKAAESGENFLSTELNGKFGPAFITAPYGKGPWGRILLPDSK